MNQINNKPNSIVLTLLKLTPLFGIGLMSLMHAMNALSGEGILLSILLVSIICSILIILDNTNEEDTTSLVIQFFVTLFVWFIAYPIYFLQKQDREKQGNFPLLAAAMTFVIIIGFGELYRFGYLKSSSESLSQLVNLVLLAFFNILCLSAPIIFANIFNSIKKSTAIILTLISFAIVFVPTLLGAALSTLLLASLISLIIYIFALRMAFHRASLSNIKQLNT